MRVIDPKCHIENEQIIKTSNGEPIPDDEPLILFRARDELAVLMLLAYRHICVANRCTEYQIRMIDARILEFERFAAEHPERMKQPGVTHGR